MTARTALVEFLSNRAPIIQAGLPANEVYQADTLDSPSGRPFLVLRWMDTGASVGRSTVRPVEGYVYDERGDYTRADRIGKAILRELESAIPIDYDDGVISQFRTFGDGLGRGRDMFDAGWDAVVIPYYFQVIDMTR